MADRLRRVGWTQSARDGLDQILAFIAQDSPEAAAKVLEVVLQTGRTLKAQRVGLGVPDMQKLRGLFEAASQKLATLGPVK